MKPLPSVSAAPFIRRATSDEVDWAELYDQFGSRVFHLLRRMTGDSALAEDLTQDAFVRIHKARGHYRGDGPLAAWVFRIAGNLGRDALRRGRHRTQLAHQAPAATRETPNEELRLSLRQALSDLEVDARTVVLLHDVDGFSHREIAEALGIQEGTSRARLSRARAQLRLALADRKGPRP
jgi:RNA polymerase sigma-70 factor (ECF subfamily)